MNVVGTVELQGGKAIMTLQPQQPQQPPDVTPPPRPAGVGENRGMDRAKWKRSITELLTASNKKIVHMLEQDGLLPKWSNHLCPRCWKGTLRSMVHQDLPKYKCCAKACRSMVVPHELHPLFQVSKGKQHQPLQVQAALLFLLLTGASHAQCRLLLQVNHKMIEGMSSRLQVLLQSYVQEEEQKIIFGDGKSGWMSKQTKLHSIVLM